MFIFIQIARSIFLMVVLLNFSVAQAQTIDPTIATTNLPNIVTVAHQDADFTTISAALDSIYDASATNPYLIIVAPGEYKVRSRIMMKEYVYLKGSGRELTKLVGKVRGETKSLIDATYNSSIESMSIEIPRNFNFPATMVVEADRGNIRMKDVSIRIDVHPSITAPAIAVYSDDNDIYLDNVEIRAFKSGGKAVGVSSDYGFDISNSSIIAATIGVEITFIGSGIIDNSRVFGSEAAVFSYGSFESPGEIRYDISNSLIRSSSNGVPIKEEVFSGGFPAEFLVTRSSIISNAAGIYTQVTDITCLFNDNGEGQALDSDCNDLL